MYLYVYMYVVEPFTITVHEEMPSLPISDEFSGTVCFEETRSLSSKSVQNYTCTILGRVVVIQKPNKDYLALCEVEVYGEGIYTSFIMTIW